MTNVVRALLHLAGKIESGSHDKVRISSPNFHLGVESPEIDLGSRKSLLPDGELFAQFRQI